MPGLASSLLLMAASAAAPASPATARPARVDASVVLARSPAPDEVSTFHVSPSLRARYRVLPHLDLALDWGVSYTETSARASPTLAHLGMGNPLLGAHYIVGQEGARALRLGLGLGAPLALRGLTRPCCGIPASVAEDLNYTAAAAARGLAEPWMWRLNTASVVLPIVGEARLGASVVGRVDLTPAALIPVTGPFSDSALALVAGAEAEIRAGWWTPGLRLRLASFSERVAAGDFAQASIEPFLRADLGRGYTRLGVLLNLDPPRGIGGERGAWAFNAGGGLAF